LVSDYTAPNSDGVILYYKGFMRTTNTEFIHHGQFSRMASDDQKFGILFSNLQEYNSSRPTYIRNSSFHHGYYAAIGILGSNGLPIENNVIYHSIDYSILVEESHSTKLRSNLAILTYWASSFLTSQANFDLFLFGAFELIKADSIVLENNYIAGAERYGLNYKGDICAGEWLFPSNKSHSIKNNEIYSSLVGVVILPLNLYKGFLFCFSKFMKLIFSFIINFFRFILV
jgi:hypothetical protein